MSRYKALFEKLSAKGEGAFIPFVVLGDPNIELSQKIIQALIDAGADALELGLAFSDPVADGPVIQRADMRVLRQGVRTAQVIDLLKALRRRNPDIPMGILTYANLVVHKGVDGFYKGLHEAGVDSLLIADVPTLEIEPFLEASKKFEVEQVLIVPPNVDDERLRFIATHSQGYVYVVTRKGVTGADQTLSLSSKDVFDKLKRYGASPGIYGFGISAPEHVKDALKAGAAGAISGSAITSIIEKNLGDEKALLGEVTKFVRNMKSATMLSCRT
jgi:tryptophan synthase alpha chain